MVAKKVTLTGYHFIATTLLATSTLASCDVVRRDESPGFDDLFPEVARIVLQPDPDEPMANISSLIGRPDGGVVVVDGRTHRVREFDASGRLEHVLGGPGRGPGGLRDPSAAMLGPNGELHVVERGSSRRTVFWPGDSVSISTLPGLYGFAIQRIPDGYLVGLGTEDERLAILSSGDELVARFARRDPRIALTPYWIYYAQERVAVFGDLVFVNSSFSPVVRVFSTLGDSLYSIRGRPTGWMEATHPGVSSVATAGDRVRMDSWARSFTVVAGLVATSGVVVVQYGRHDPKPDDPYGVKPITASVFSIEGQNLASGIELGRRILAGGERVYVLESEPPDAWTISVRVWSRPRLRDDSD